VVAPLPQQAENGVVVGFRLRKSLKMVPGVKLNVSKTGLGASVGGKYGRYSAHSSGRRTVSFSTGVPGVYYQQSASGRGRQPGARAAPAQAPANAPKPGLFAPKGEKELYKAVKAQSVPAIRAVGDTHPEFRSASYSLAGLMLLSADPAQAQSLLTRVFDTGAEPAQDRFVVKYLATWTELPIAAGVSAALPVCRDAVGLALAELRQEAGDLAGAIDVVERLEPTTYAAVSLAELYLQVDRLDDVVELTEGITNEDDATALLLVFRGAAFRRQGFHDAAHESLKQALRSRSRAAPIRHLALSERAENYLAQGKKAMARKDLERILAEDSGYEGVRERLDELAG
jgi:tetratricopeptide (TPR) repeat protein